MIAVGGDVLSRGLTLDGLTTSYFYRRAGAFDTLMQMARWFGYRDGYAGPRSALDLRRRSPISSGSSTTLCGSCATTSQ